MRAVTVGLVLLAVGVAAAVSGAAQSTDASSTVPVVVVMGEATVRRAPDRAFVTITVEISARSPRDAQAQNAQLMTAVQQRLTAVRIPREAVRTLGYDLEPEFDYADGRRTRRGFVARHSIEVRVDEVTRVGEIVDAAVQAGATSATSVRFDLQDRDGAEREALRLAVVDARARADAAAGGAGRTIDRVLRIQDTREAPPPIASRPMMAMRAAEAQPSTPIEPATIEIRARVTLTASMK